MSTHHSLHGTVRATTYSIQNPQRFVFTLVMHKKQFQSKMRQSSNTFHQGCNANTKATIILSFNE